MADETGIVLPPGVSRPSPPADFSRGMIVNETDLPDAMVQRAVETFVEEHASVLGVNSGSTFQSYSNGDGSLLARRQFRVPKSPLEEVALARELAERDDDVASTIGAMIATAFGDGMQNTHEDEVAVALFDEAAKHANLDGVLAEMYRELLIASSVTTVSLFTTEQFSFQPSGADRARSRSLVVPLIGVLPAECIRVVGNDIVGTGTLAYKPMAAAQEMWLAEFFAPSTTPARKAEMRRQDPVLTTLLLGPVDEKDDETSITPELDDPNLAQNLYRLNPRMVQRSTFPKGAWKYPRPLLTRNFALLEAKRLLNIMDYALLQGGSNFLVVAKKGSDQRPALPEEVGNLRETLRRATRTGVIVGDHRLSIEIITPQLTELLNPQKRKLLGRKIAMGLLRLPEFAEADSGAGQAVLTDTEIVSRVVAYDRRLVKRHTENGIYAEIVKRNPQSLTSPASIWFPKIILQGLQYFTDLVLKLRDRGDIPRKYAVEAGGFNYEAAVQQRKREKSAGDDRVMTPAAVPFSSPNAGPQDNNSGRPPGASPNNGSGAPAVQRSAPAQVRPSSVVTRNAGETVRAMHEEEVGSFRVGELTYAILDEYADTRRDGRITSFERRALDRIAAGEGMTLRDGPLVVVPVNVDERLDDERAVRLVPGLSVILGYRDDLALMARALVFREPEFDLARAEETALRWGFDVEPLDEFGAEPAAPGTHVHVHVHADGSVHDEFAAWEELAKGGVAKGKYVYLRCPNCGLVQDAANDQCKRCHIDLAPARRAMFASLRDKGQTPMLHDKPPPPMSEQPDLRKSGG